MRPRSRSRCMRFDGLPVGTRISSKWCWPFFYGRRRSRPWQKKQGLHVCRREAGKDHPDRNGLIDRPRESPARWQDGEAIASDPARAACWRKPESAASSGGTSSERNMSLVLRRGRSKNGSARRVEPLPRGTNEHEAPHCGHEMEEERGTSASA